MITRAVLRYIRMSPRKFRLIIPLVRGKRAEEALATMASIKKIGAVYATELLKSALANAKRIQGVDPSALYISKLIASPGPMLKRYRAASMGRASMIRKRTVHITLELDEMKTPGHKAAPAAALRAGKAALKKEVHAAGAKAKAKSEKAKVQGKAQKVKR